MTQTGQAAPAEKSPGGPGLAESLLWTVGCHLVQMLVFAALAAGLLWCAVPSFPPSLEEVSRIVDDLGWESSFLFNGATTLAALLVIVPLVRMRIGRDARRSLGLTRLSAAQVVLVAAAVAPLGVLSDCVYRWGLEFNDLLAKVIPELAMLARIDAMHVIQQQAESTSYPILLVAIALGPAISEEFVFRGLIGRGLISRWGANTGILLTTLLFALAHGTPAHALATIPVGLCLHTVYLMTGTLWAPILLHTLNNALAVTLMKLQADVSLAGAPALLFATVGYLVVVIALLSEATGERGTTVGVALRLRRSVSPAFPVIAAGSILSFTCVFVWSRIG